MTDNSKAIHDLGVGMTVILELFTPIREATLGYRNQMIAGGVDALVADGMAADFHQATVQLILTQMTKGTA